MVVAFRDVTSGLQNMNVVNDKECSLELMSKLHKRACPQNEFWISPNHDHVAASLFKCMILNGCQG